MKNNLRARNNTKGIKRKTQNIIIITVTTIITMTNYSVLDIPFSKVHTQIRRSYICLFKGFLNYNHRNIKASLCYVHIFNSRGTHMSKCVNDYCIRDLIMCTPFIILGLLYT